MPEVVFPFLNLTLTDDEIYTNNELGIRIEPTDIAEDFAENHRELGSDYRWGYWHTANVYIEQPEDRAKKIASTLSQILSFALWRDVRFEGRYPENSEDAPFLPIRTASFGLDNTNIPVIRGIFTGQPNPGLKYGPFIDRVLNELYTTDETERLRKLRPISQFLESSSAVYESTKFILLWIALESCANENYEEYREKKGDLFTDPEREKFQNDVIEEANERFDERQVNFLETRIRQNHLYEHSIDLKIKIYLKHLDIGFDMDEIEEIVKESKEIRNLVVHESDSSRLMEGDINRTGELRKILIFVILRRIGVDRGMQEKLVTPMFPGPEISDK